MHKMTESRNCFKNNLDYFVFTCIPVFDYTVIIYS